MYNNINLHTVNLYNKIITHNKDCYKVTQKDNFDNLPENIKYLIVKCEPDSDLLNLPVSLQYIFFDNENISFDTETIVKIEEGEEQMVEGEEQMVEGQMVEGETEGTIIFNGTERQSMRESGFFNCVQPYANCVPSSGIYTYSFPLYSEKQILILKMKVPFGCKIYNHQFKMVEFNGILKITK